MRTLKLSELSAISGGDGNDPTAVGGDVPQPLLTPSATSPSAPVNPTTPRTSTEEPPVLDPQPDPLNPGTSGDDGNDDYC